VLFVLVMGGIYLLREYTPLFAAGEVIFEGYTPYDDRINPPILYASNYRIEPDTPKVQFKHDTTLPGPYIECTPQADCSTFNEVDEWGCGVYFRASSTNRYGGSCGAYDNMCNSGDRCVGNIGCCDYGCHTYICDLCEHTTPSSTCGGRIMGNDVYECKENTCSGETSTTTDDYGCTKYFYTTTWTQPNTCSGPLYNQHCNSCPGGCTGGGERCSGGTSSSDCWCSCSSTCESGGAKTSTCQGDDCYVKGTCNDRDVWSLDNPLKTLQEWKSENPNQLELVSTGCNNGCLGKLMSYEDDFWLYEGSSGVAFSSDWGCHKGTLYEMNSDGQTIILKGGTGKYRDSSRYINPTLTLTSKNMRDTTGFVKDVRIRTYCGGGDSYKSYSTGADYPLPATCNIKIGTNSYNIPHTEEVLLELFSSKINPDVSEVHLNGQFQENIYFTDLTNVNITFSTTGGSPRFEIREFGYLLPFNCQQDGDELLGVETFGPGEISLYNLRYTPTKFCTEHPAMIVSQTGSGSSTTNEVYDKLRRGEVLTIPDTQTWTLFYIFYNDGSISVQCPEGSLNLDHEPPRCEEVSGSVFFCTVGTWDASAGSCAVTPDDVDLICPYGRYDVDHLGKFYQR